MAIVFSSYIHAPIIMLLVFTSMFAFSAVTNADIITGLVGHWRLDENSGTTAIDAGGNHGTLSGAALPAWVSGHNGYALSFDGSAAYVALPDDIFNSHSAGTVAAWIKLDSLLTAGQAVEVFSSASATAVNNLLALDVYSPSGVSNRLRIGARLNSNFYYGGSTLTPGQWYHAVYVSDGSDWTLYLNGTAETLTAQLGANSGEWFDSQVSGVMRYAIGVNRRSSGNANYFPGAIDDVRVYNRALSSSDVQELYRAATLVGWWKLDETAGTTAADSSGNHNDGTLAGATKPSPAPGIRGGAMSFDGTSSRINTTYAASLGDFTVCGWFLDNGSTGNARIVDKSYTTGFWLGRGNNVWGGGILQSAFPYGTFVSLPQKGWHHLCMSRSGTVQTIVGDGGAAVNSAVVSSSALSTTTVSIGHGGSAPFSGSLDDVRIWDRALSVAEIKALYLGGVVNGAVLRNGKNNL